MNYRKYLAQYPIEPEKIDRLIGICDRVEPKNRLEYFYDIGDLWMKVNLSDNKRKNDEENSGQDQSEIDQQNERIDSILSGFKGLEELLFYINELEMFIVLQVMKERYDLETS